jgi:hypothetical protein
MDGAGTQLTLRDAERAVRPWYRELWPWLLAAGPAAVIVAGMVTMYIAFHGSDALVSEDYYVRGLAINGDLAREAYARQAGISAQIARAADGAQILLQIRGGSASDFPAVLKLSLVHPVRAELDRTVEAARLGNGSYAARAGALSGHRWKVEIETAQWRLSGEWRDPDQPADIGAR